MKQNIVHAGGRIGIHKYTNSVEAVLRSIAIGEKMIELDCVRLADGFGFAHDGVERDFYNETRTFHKIPLDQFSHLRVFKKYTPMTFHHLRDMMMITDHIIPVIDFMGNLEEFDNLLDYCKSELRQYFYRLCFQVYDIEWTEALVRKGGRVGLPALWKFFDANPFSDAAIAFLSHSVAWLPFAPGVSLRWQNPVTKKRNLDAPNLPKIQEHYADIFFHGQDTDLRFHEQIALNKRFGFFSALSLKSVPPDFNPTNYTKLHADLQDMNAVRAICHYVEFGYNENRRYL